MTRCQGKTTSNNSQNNMSQSELSKSMTAGLENDSIAKAQDKNLMNINMNDRGP